MSKFGRWEKIADAEFYGAAGDRGPGVYQLGFGARGRQPRQPAYTGKATNLADRTSRHARGGSHLARPIDERLAAGQELFARVIRTSSAAEAGRREARMLATARFPLNVQGQAWCDDDPDDDGSVLPVLFGVAGVVLLAWVAAKVCG